MKISFQCLWKELLEESLRPARWRTKMEILEALKRSRVVSIPACLLGIGCHGVQFFRPLKQTGVPAAPMEENFLKKILEARFKRATY